MVGEVQWWWSFGPVTRHSHAYCTIRNLDIMVKMLFLYEGGITAKTVHEKLYSAIAYDRLPVAN